MTDLNSLLIFAKVVEAKSFSEAARRLKMPTSTVSRRVADLEDQLGVRLLERSTRNLRLTDVGSEVFEHAQHSTAQEHRKEAHNQQMDVQTQVAAPPRCDRNTPHFQELEEDGCNAKTRQVGVGHAHAATDCGNEDDEVSKCGDEDTSHTSSPMERIISNALLFVTTPSRSLKSNIIRPPRSSSWKCTFRKAPSCRPEMSVNARS